MRNKRPLSEEEFKEKIDRQNDRVCGLLTVPANTSGVPEGYVEIDDEDCPF